MYRIEFEMKPGKWKKDFVLIQSKADAEAYLESYIKSGVNARLTEEGEECTTAIGARPCMTKNT